MDFGLRVVRLVEALPKSGPGRVIGNQLLRSGTSIGANYRAACTARSKAEFAAKLGIVEEEAEETAYWIEMPMEAAIVPRKRLEPLLAECRELLAMVIASIKTSRGNRSRKQ